MRERYGTKERERGRERERERDALYPISFILYLHTNTTAIRSSHLLPPPPRLSPPKFLLFISANTPPHALPHKHTSPTPNTPAPYAGPSHGAPRRLGVRVNNLY